jgi:hypothetical protein
MNSTNHVKSETGKRGDDGKKPMPISNDGRTPPARKQMLRKTKFCAFHLQGVCQYHDTCTFAHSVEELQGLPRAKLEASDQSGSYQRPPCVWHEKEPRATAERQRHVKATDEKARQRNGTTSTVYPEPTASMLPVSCDRAGPPGLEDQRRFEPMYVQSSLQLGQEPFPQPLLQMGQEHMQGDPGFRISMAFADATCVPAYAGGALPPGMVSQIELEMLSENLEALSMHPALLEMQMHKHTGQYESEVNMCSPLVGA